VPSVGRPWSRTGKSAFARTVFPAAPTRSCCERQPITACTGDANACITDRGDRSRRDCLAAADFQHGTASVRSRRPPPSDTAAGLPPDHGDERVGHRARQPCERGRSRSPQLRAAGSPRGDFGPCDPWPAHHHGRCMPVRTSSGSAANRRGRGRVRTGGAHVPARDPGCPRPMADPIGACCRPLTESGRRSCHGPSPSWPSHLIATIHSTSSSPPASGGCRVAECATSRHRSRPWTPYGSSRIRLADGSTRTSMKL
jgi:hypothetical protein